MAVTLNDVAKRARVSPRTVSNVVSGYPHVSALTRNRVQKALDDLGYQPNLSARSLRGGRSGVVTLAVPRLNPYFSELAYMVERAVTQAGYILLVDQTEGLRERENRVVRGIRAQLIDGLIFAPFALAESTIAQIRSTTPLVLLGERVSPASIDHVAIDNVAAARQAVNHLINLGRRRIAAIGTLRPVSGDPARLRLAGYAAALKEGGLPHKEKLTIPVRASGRLEGLRGTRRLLAGGARPDAIFAFNDELALGALRALFEAGLLVPDDVAVVGFDDVEEGQFSVPTLTTISPDKQRIAESAVASLIERMNGKGETGPRDTVVPHALIPRESTLGLPGRKKKGTGPFEGGEARTG